MKADDLDKLTLTPTAPRRLGKYVLLGRLGHGGMGKIYLAFLPGPAGIEKLLVIKRLHGHLTEDKALVESFLDEAKLSMAINHPNVVHTFDVGELDKRFFMVMEYVEGQNLGVLLRTAKRANHYPSSEIWAGLFVEVLDGLHAAHIATDARGRPFNIIHRDVSPQNIIVGYDGIPKLVDFGIAKAAMRINQTDAGVLKGKYAYMSPEQCQTNELDPRSDIFSAGIVLWEMLAGRRLYKSDHVLRSVERIVKEKPVPPSDINPEANPIFNSVVIKALQKDPKDRFQTAEEFRDALDECLIDARFHYKKSTVRQLMKVCFLPVIERQRKILEECLEAHKNLSNVPVESEQEFLREDNMPLEMDQDDNAQDHRDFHALQDEGEATTPSSSALHPLMTAEGEVDAIPGGIKTVAQRRGSVSKNRVEISEVVEIDANTRTASHVFVPVDGPKPKRGIAAGLYLLVIGSILAIVGMVVYPTLAPQNRSTATSPNQVDKTPNPKGLEQNRTAVQEPVPTGQKTAGNTPEPQKGALPPDQNDSNTEAEVLKDNPSEARSTSPKKGKSRKRNSTPRSTAQKKKQTTERLSQNPKTETSEKPIQKVEAEESSSSLEQTGFLTLDTAPWTNVYLNGKKLGETPINRLKVPAGKIKLVLKNSAEGIEQEYWVTIRPGELTRKRLGLQ